MNAIQTLLTDHLDIWTAADTEKKSGRGRSSGNADRVYGIKKLRELILELAVRGKLVPQDPNDEPADSCLTKARLELRAKGKGARRSAWKETALVSEDDKRFDLPKGWTWARVNDTGFYINGLAFKPADWSESGKPIIRIQNLTDRSKPLNCAQGEFPDEVTVRTGDLLVSWSATLDAFIWDRGEAVLNQHIFRVIPCHELVIPGFHYWLLKVSIREMEESDHAHGLVMTHINRDPFLAHVVAIPPLAEQHRIVAKVDELMALCDQLEKQQTHSLEAHQALVEALLGTLTRVESQQEFSKAWARIASHFDTLFTTETSIAQLKQTILQLAVMGKLVPQDPNDEPANALLKRIQTEKAKLIAEGKIKKDKPLAAIAEDEKPFELPQGWEWVRFFTVNTVQSELVSAKDFPLENQIAPDSIDKGNGLLLSHRTVAECGSIGPNNKFYEGQILYSKIRPSLNKAVVAPYDGLCSADMYPIKAHVNAEFMLKVILSEVFLAQVRLAENRIKMPKLNLESLGQFIVPLPPLAEQHRIVAKVDELMALCDALKARLADAQAIQLRLADTIVEQAVC